MKKIRKAVRTFLIKDNKVLVIKYTKPDINGYFDIPGGKIEKNENSIEASIREFKEETGMDILNPQKVGRLVLEYPDRIFDFDIFICYEYKGNPIETAENKSLWIDIEKIVNEDKIFASIHMLDMYRVELLKNKNFDLHFIVNANHKLIKVIN